MGYLASLLDFQAAVRPTEIVESHREPTHPAVRAMRFGKGQRLAYFALVAQAAGAIVTFHHTRVDLLVAQEIEHMGKPCFPMHRSHFNPRNPTAFIAFLDLAIRQALPPAQHWTTVSALGRIPTTEHLQKRRLVARISIGNFSFR